MPEEAEKIELILGQGNPKCPYLHAEGICEYYCGIAIEEVENNMELTGQIVLEQLRSWELGTYCMGKYTKCNFFIDEINAGNT